MTPPSRSFSRSSSLVLSETAFFDAALLATKSHSELKHENANEMIKVATTFLTKACPEFLTLPKTPSHQDRLIKVGRNVSSTLALMCNNGSKTKGDASLKLVADECRELTCLKDYKVPKVRFGKTELEMPVVTLGCMRFQQSWNRGAAPIVDKFDKVQQECQDNLVDILKYAIGHGVTHIETAKGYGSSELQLGHALQHLFQTGYCKRSDLLIQTKGGVSSSMTIEDYRNQVLGQLELLQVDYVDLYSVHGVNTEDSYKYLFENDASKGNLIEALRQLQAEGKIRHIGFSTHGNADFITKVLNTKAFEYVNLHYQFCGSYTASGDGMYGGNLQNVLLANELDMGVFCISPYDKGGRVYAPSNKLREVTLPDMEPMTYASHWLWNHDQLVEEKARVHTMTVGAARPSDLDQPIVASRQFHKTLDTVKIIQQRLDRAMADAVGENFAKTWHVGLPNSRDARYGTQLGNIVWLYNLIKGWGLLDFCKERYAPMEGNLKSWSMQKTYKENVANMPLVWGWCPGCAVDPSIDYTPDLTECPDENREQILQAIDFVHKWCSKNNGQEEEKDAQVPMEWKTAYDMRPWTAFPERTGL